MVEAASTLARSAGVSDWAIGGTIVAAGTSTPELAVSLVAMRRGHVGMSVGNVVGSNVFNVLGIMGIAAFLPAARGRRRGNRDGPLADSRHGRHGRRAVVRTAALPH